MSDHTKMAAMVFVIIAAVSVATAMGRDGISIQNYFTECNDVLSIDYKDGTLAVGTPAGLYVLRDGSARRFDEQDGLWGNVVPNVLLLDDHTLLAGPFRQNDGWGFCRIDFEGPSLVVRDITGGETFIFEDTTVPRYTRMVALAPDGSFWVGDATGLHRYDGSSWSTYPWPSSLVHESWERMCINKFGVIWGTLATDTDQRWDRAFRFDAGTWSTFDFTYHVCGIGIDPNGTAYCVAQSPPSLWRYGDEGWDMVSQDLCWHSRGPSSSEGANMMHWDDNGVLWMFRSQSIVKWAHDPGAIISEIDGIGFEMKVPWSFFQCTKYVSPTTFLAGTLHNGLLIIDGESCSRLYLNGIPGNAISMVADDAHGAHWVSDDLTFLLGSFDGHKWYNLYAPWLPYHGYHSDSATDLDGGQWFIGRFGPVKMIDRQATVFDSGISRVSSDSKRVVVDREGVKWFLQDVFVSQDASLACLVSYDDAFWTEYRPERHLSSYSLSVEDLVVGRDDAKWVITLSQGCVAFDGVGWRHLYFGQQLPDFDWTDILQLSLSFALDGQFLFYGTPGVWRGEPGDDWEQIFPDRVLQLQQDSEGTLWLSTENGLAYGTGNTWNTIDVDDGLSSNTITTITIDHNGDKWVGTEHGLNRIEDGGPAQQKLELAAEVTPDGYVTVTGTFTNAGAVIPVLLWLACEHDGTLYYYPAWGPTPEGTKRVLGAYSIETEPLLRLDTSSLPPGDYTFYGGISLLGGMDLLIGARGNKIAVATYHKD